MVGPSPGPVGPATPMALHPSAASPLAAGATLAVVGPRATPVVRGLAAAGGPALDAWPIVLKGVEGGVLAFGPRAGSVEEIIWAPKIA